MNAPATKERPLACKCCRANDFDFSWQNFANDARHIRVSCRRCERFVKYLPQSRTPQLPFLGLLVSLLDAGVEEMFQDGASVILYSTTCASDYLRPEVMRHLGALMRLLPKATEQLPNKPCDIFIETPCGIRRKEQWVEAK